ncbi:methyltransferase [Candidatus Bipolaricaulota bacterium]|nr:methyltransferase [Candidatus Bipolaricaulota bacterium]
MVQRAREMVEKTLDFENPERVPRDLWFLPAVDMFQKEEKREILERFPPDIVKARFEPGTSEVQRNSPLPECNNASIERPEKGKRYIDEWGSVFRVAEDGVIGEVKEPVIEDWDELNSFEPPWDYLETTDLSRVDESCRKSEKFTLSGLCGHPFERLQYLRGSENLYRDLIRNRKEVEELLEIIHRFNLERIGMWLNTEVDAVTLMDDWGGENSLLVSPELWRSLFKPLYKEYCDLIHEHDKYVFFHSDGFIEDIYPDLIEVGVDALNSQLFVMDIEKLAAKYRGEITFWGEIDRRLLALGTPAEVSEATSKAREHLDDGRGGVIAQCEWGKNNPKENIEAVFRTWE